MAKTAEHVYITVTFPSYILLGEKNASAYQLRLTKEMQGDVCYKRLK